MIFIEFTFCTKINVIRNLRCKFPENPLSFSVVISILPVSLPGDGAVRTREEQGKYRNIFWHRNYFLHNKVKSTTNPVVAMATIFFGGPYHLEVNKQE